MKKIMLFVLFALCLLGCGTKKNEKEKTDVKEIAAALDDIKQEKRTSIEVQLVEE